LTANGVNNVTASINAAGTGIDITDTNAVPLGLRVDDISMASSTASDLGIVGDINPILSGQALNPLLDFSVSEAAVDQTTAADLGLLGDFSMAWVGDGLAPIITADTPLALLNNGLGFDLGQIRISQGRGFTYLDLGNSTFSTVGDLIDALNATGFDIEASINEAGTGIQVISTSSTQSLKIEEVASGSTAHDLGIFGSPDILGSMMILVDALRNNDREVTGQIIGNLNDAMQELLNHRASVGAKVIRLETTDSRLTELDFNFTKMLSEVEDADLTKLVSDLASQENSYQAALIASAKIIQPSLLDFLQ
jgi:flagellin-like hook-associated protein FlgL